MLWVVPRSMPHPFTKFDENQGQKFQQFCRQKDETRRKRNFLQLRQNIEEPVRHATAHEIIKILKRKAFVYLQL